MLQIPAENHNILWSCFIESEASFICSFWEFSQSVASMYGWAESGLTISHKVIQACCPLHQSIQSTHTSSYNYTTHPHKPHVSLKKISNLIKIYLFIISFILVQSKWNFAYTKTAKLSWYMQNFIVIGEDFNGLVYINIHNYSTPRKPAACFTWENFKFNQNICL